MHPCFKIPEIVALITREIPEGGVTRYDYQSASRNTLAKLARTCRSLSGHALDELWRVQISLEPLMGILPLDGSEVDKAGVRFVSFLRHAQFTNH